MDQDILYHLALGSGSHDLVEMFGDVKASRTRNPHVRFGNDSRFSLKYVELSEQDVAYYCVISITLSNTYNINNK